eukprot:6188420-Pleurochrysis_carterae.AAC.2
MLLHGRFLTLGCACFNGAQMFMHARQPLSWPRPIRAVVAAPRALLGLAVLNLWYTLLRTRAPPRRWLAATLFSLVFPLVAAVQGALLIIALVRVQLLRNRPSAWVLTARQKGAEYAVTEYAQEGAEDKAACAQSGPTGSERHGGSPHAAIKRTHK